MAKLLRCIGVFSYIDSIAVVHFYDAKTILRTLHELIIDSVNSTQMRSRLLLEKNGRTRS